MSDYLFSQISEVHGLVHTGPGNLNVTFNGDRPWSPLAHAAEDLARHARSFVHPRGFGDARRILETYRTVLLDGPPGSGRNAAARVLLYELSSGNERFHELLWDDDPQRPRLDPGHIGDDDRVWLDLSQVEEWVWRDVQRVLPTVRNAVIDRGAYLAVVLPNNRIEPVLPDFAPFHTKISRPPETEVLRRHLRLNGIPDAHSAPAPPELAEYLDGEPPLGEVAALAQFTAEAMNISPRGDLSGWLATALEAVTRQDDVVAGNIAELPDGRRRALLLATAMLHGSHAEIVDQAAGRLLAAVKFPNEPSRPLEGEDLFRMFKAVNARLDDSGHVRFERLGYDTAVRIHFWNHMPGYRAQIQAWVVALADSPALEPDERAGLVDRFADLCINERHWSTLADAVFRWTTEPTNERRVAAADRALRRAVVAQNHGRLFRQQIRMWAMDERLSERLAEVIVKVCAEVVVINHPDEAMVRLHHRARRERRSTAAREALIRLVTEDLRLRRQLLARLTRVPDGGRAWDIDPDIYLEIADPEAFTRPGPRHRPLIAEAEVRTMLTDGWRRTLTEVDDARWRPRVAEWFALARADERHREALAGTPIEAVGERGDILGRLYATARDLPCAAPGDQERQDAFVEFVLRRITDAQGLQTA
ncbi:hypothetical protein DP939_22250 [Spongiactinospora rosea]|uniref:LigA protein n=1 Tax=Spongiactinospora rosea TaxID=2248750 RepID=A0A366LWF6_9ACTN|nr:hypothetical protein [Spongiactinospora rosea]RBQ18087.1 hypothetical protein DP939_22250 [Spongiactinospora rosea]